jgi:hypothetical protein
MHISDYVGVVLRGFGASYILYRYRYDLGRTESGVERKGHAAIGYPEWIARMHACTHGVKLGILHSPEDAYLLPTKSQTTNNQPKHTKEYFLLTG